jgi:hypothetical protein
MKPRLKRTAERTAKAIPIRSLTPFKFENGSVSKAIPITPKKKASRSYRLTRSPIIKKLINEVRKGLYRIITIFERSVNLTAKNSVAKPRKPVTHLIVKHIATCLLISKGDTLKAYRIPETIIMAKRDLKYKISKTVILLI